MASLGADLAAIRKNSGLSFEDIQERTKLSPNIITSIEDGSIFENLDKNKTYIRSYVRNYAKAFGVTEAAIVKALDEVEKGRYEGNIDPMSNDKDEQPEPDDAEETPDEMIEERFLEFEENEPETNVVEQEEFDRKETIDWAKFSHKVVRQRKKRSLASGKVIGTLLILILAALVVFLFIYFNDNSEPTQKETTTSVSEPIAPADSPQEALLPKEETAAELTTGEVSLPDTLMISLIAATGKLEPVRVYTDIMEIRRPYWVELHDTLYFEFVDLFSVKAADQLDRMQILFNGHIIENARERFYNTGSGMIELSRSIIENHPEWFVSVPNNNIL